MYAFLHLIIVREMEREKVETKEGKKERANKLREEKGEERRDLLCHAVPVQRPSYHE
jgi:hypothetical protein